MTDRVVRKIGGSTLPDSVADDRAREFGSWAMDSYGRVINYLARYYQAYLDINLAPYGFSSAHFPLLAYLWEGHTGDTQNSIARVLGVDKGTISRNIQALVRLGLIVQNPCARDTRACTVELTEKGWSLAEPVTAVARRWTDSITGEMDPENIATVLSALQDMTVKAEDMLREAQMARAGMGLVETSGTSLIAEVQASSSDGS